MKSNIVKYLVMPFFAMSLSTSLWADTPGQHPHYLHALSNLRAARAYLQSEVSPSVDHAEEHAIHEIDGAINEIKLAGIDDGKNINAHEPVEMKLKHSDRFHKALKLINEAEHDSSLEEDQVNAQGLQKRVLTHIRESKQAVQKVLETVFKHN